MRDECIRIWPRRTLPARLHHFLHELEEDEVESVAFVVFCPAALFDDGLLRDARRRLGDNEVAQLDALHELVGDQLVLANALDVRRAEDGLYLIFSNV